MICPKCGKDVGDYKYCPDCAILTIQVTTSSMQSNSPPQNPVPMPAIKGKMKSYGMNRFFAIVISLQIVFCLVAFWLFSSCYKDVNGGILMMVVIILQVISSVGCLVFSQKLKFWMMFPYALTGFLVALSMLFISEQLNSGGCFLILFWPIMLFGVISAILAPISKIPHKEDA